MVHSYRRRRIVAILTVFALALAARAGEAPSLKQTVDVIVDRLYDSMDQEALGSLTEDQIMQIVTPEERQLLATRYWSLTVNVPVVVSVIRHVEQKPLPFWLEPAGFLKTGLTVKNDMWTYEVWQKEYGPGRIELGINGFDRHLPAYFVCVGPKDPNDTVTIAGVFPEDCSVIRMEPGAWTYRDWDDLYLTEVPQSLLGQSLLTTYRGRAWEAHLIGGFRTTPYPSSARPDQIMLSWSEDPRTTQTIQWRTGPEVKTGTVRFRPENEPERPYEEVLAESALIDDQKLMNDRFTYRHTAVLRGLNPSTTYTYSVGSPGNGVWSEPTPFRTAPDGKAPFSFVFLGDTHNSPHWGDMLRLAESDQPQTAFYAVGGDMVSTGLYRNEWDELFEYGAGVINRRPLMFCLGNHDNSTGLGAWLPLALAEFPKNGPEGVEPERNFAFQYSNALFLVLDVSTPFDVQTKWLDAQLSEHPATWRFVLFHFPLYSLEEDDEYKAIREAWEPVFAKHHVDFALHGHVHYYLRTKPMRLGEPTASPAEGTVYIISLAIPGRERPRQPTPFVEKYLSGGPWYQRFDIDGNSLTYKAFDGSGVLCDELTVRK